MGSLQEGGLGEKETGRWLGRSSANKGRERWGKHSSKSPLPPVPLPPSMTSEVKR